MEGNFEGNFVSPAPELHFSRTLNHRHTFRKCIKCNPALENGQVEFIGFEVDEKHFMDSVGRIKFYLNKDI